jgi:hypothetical protein
MKKFWFMLVLGMVLSAFVFGGGSTQKETVQPEPTWDELASQILEQERQEAEAYEREKLIALNRFNSLYEHSGIVSPINGYTYEKGGLYLAEDFILYITVGLGMADSPDYHKIKEEINSAYERLKYLGNHSNEITEDDQPIYPRLVEIVKIYKDKGELWDELAFPINGDDYEADVELRKAIITKTVYNWAERVNEYHHTVEDDDTPIYAAGSNRIIGFYGKRYTNFDLKPTITSLKARSEADPLISFVNSNIPNAMKVNDVWETWEEVFLRYFIRGTDPRDWRLTSFQLLEQIKERKISYSQFEEEYQKYQPQDIKKSYETFTTMIQMLDNLEEVGYKSGKS